MRRFASAFFAVCAFAAFVAACSSDDDGLSTCVPGQQIACACAGGAQGAQQCLANGTYGPCSACPDGGGACSVGCTTGTSCLAGTAATACGANGSACEGCAAGSVCVAVAGGGTCQAVAVDGGFDGGSDAGGGCVPADLTGFTPPPYVPPTGYRQGVCTPELMASFYSACVDADAQVGACSSTFGSLASAENQACAACLITSASAAAHGPLVDRIDSITVNLGGCLALTGGAAGEQCAQKMQAFDACVAAACAANCPISDSASYSARANCQKAAALGGCASYGVDANTCQNELMTVGASSDGGADYTPSDCYAWAASNVSTFADIYNAVAPVFCGP